MSEDLLYDIGFGLAFAVCILMAFAIQANRIRHNEIDPTGRENVDE